MIWTQFEFCQLGANITKQQLFFEDWERKKILRQAQKLVNIVKDWNSLVNSVINLESIDMLKNRLNS